MNHTDILTKQKTITIQVLINYFIPEWLYIHYYQLDGL